MVQPINYTSDVLNPIQGYLQGLKFGEGLNTDRLNQQATTQNMGIQREQMDLEQRKYEDALRMRQQQMAAAQAAARAQQARAVAGRDALLGYLSKLEEGTATPADLRRSIAENPELADQFQAFASSVSEERLNNELGFGRQLSFALANDNTDAAANLLRTRQDAAKAAGDERSAAGYQAQLMQLEENPKGLLMQTLMPMAATLDTDEFDSFYNDILGLGGGDDTFRQVRGSEIGMTGENADALYNVGPDGKVTSIGGGGTTITNTVGGGNLTPFQEKLDEGFAADASEWMQGGGADMAGQMAQLSTVLGRLEGGERLTGPEIAAQPDFLLAFTNPDALNAREQVEEVVQRNLRLILGAQFTEKEGERLIARAYNPRLDAETNAGRVRRLLLQMQSAAEQKQRMVDYALQKGTIVGYEGRMPTMADFEAAIEGSPVDPSGAGSTSVTRLRFNPETGEFE